MIRHDEDSRRGRPWRSRRAHPASPGSTGLPDSGLGIGADSIIAPSGAGPRIWFHALPDAKVVKNRLRLDIHASGGADTTDRSIPLATRRQRVDAEARRLADLGSTIAGPLGDGRTWNIHHLYGLTTRDISKSADLGLLICLTALAAMLSLKCVAFLYVGRLDELTSRTRTERTGREGQSVRRAER